MPCNAIHPQILVKLNQLSVVNKSRKEEMEFNLFEQFSLSGH